MRSDEQVGVCEDVAYLAGQPVPHDLQVHEQCADQHPRHEEQPAERRECSPKSARQTRRLTVRSHRVEALFRLARERDHESQREQHYPHQQHDVQVSSPRRLDRQYQVRDQ